MLRPFALIRLSIPTGSGKTRSSHIKLDQWNSFIQKQSKWKVLRGMPLSNIPLTKLITVASSSALKAFSPAVNELFPAIDTLWTAPSFVKNPIFKSSTGTVLTFINPDFLNIAGKKGTSHQRIVSETLLSKTKTVLI